MSRNRLRSSCRLMQHYAKAQAPAIADLTRLLGTSAGFETHVRSLLELRLAQVSSETTDEDLLDFVSNAIRDLTPTPEHALIWVRSIANRALQLVWYAELPPDRTLPAQWREEWKREEVRYTDDGGRLPRSPGAQCNILRLATGTERTSRGVRYITKTTYLLLDHLQSVGNFGQHRDDSGDQGHRRLRRVGRFRRHFPAGVSDTRSCSCRYWLIELPSISSTTPRRGRFS